MNTQELLKVLKLASPALHTRDFIPVLTHLCFNGDHVFAYNDRTGISVEYETDLKCAIPGKVLLDMLDGCGEEVTLEQKSSEVVLKDSNSTIRLPLLPSDSFVFDPELKLGPEVCKVTPELIQALELASSTSNAESIRTNLTGVTVQRDGQKLVLYSTDNMTCTKVVVSVNFKAKSNNIVGILSKDSCELIVGAYRAMAGDETSVNLYMTESEAVVMFIGEDSGVVKVVAKLVPAEVADYAAIFKANTKGSFAAKCHEDIFAAAKRAGILTANDSDPAMSLELKDGSLSISAKGALGQLNTKMKMKTTGGSGSYVVRPSLLSRTADWATVISFGAPALLLSGEQEKLHIDYIISSRGN